MNAVQGLLDMIWSQPKPWFNYSNILSFNARLFWSFSESYSRLWNNYTIDNVRTYRTHYLNPSHLLAVDRNRKTFIFRGCFWLAFIIWNVLLFLNRGCWFSHGQDRSLLLDNIGKQLLEQNSNFYFSSEKIGILKIMFAFIWSKATLILTSRKY